MLEAGIVRLSVNPFFSSVLFVKCFSSRFVRSTLRTRVASVGVFTSLSLLFGVVDIENGACEKRSNERAREKRDLYNDVGLVERRNRLEVETKVGEARKLSQEVEEEEEERARKLFQKTLRRGGGLEVDKPYGVNLGSLTRSQFSLAFKVCKSQQQEYITAWCKLDHINLGIFMVSWERLGIVLNPGSNELQFTVLPLLKGGVFGNQYSLEENLQGQQANDVFVPSTPQEA
ncbi:hypothetical protein IEQ34_014234 [Dendrobium chrysotoxum]|uniref:Uncharacterized protein n=1 Tax=Dendrobium chrysotoxum TaxID=161865 RepID=A0AAV7GJB5_DENCH|nr:hypothetical protein IEQ34_014234 [Dendrobium chrysotoxum]